MSSIPEDTSGPEATTATLSLQDVVYSLSYRAEVIEKQNGQVGQLDRKDQLKIKDLDGANEWLTKHMKINPQATIQEAYRTVMSETIPDDPDEVKSWKGARNTLGTYTKIGLLAELPQAEQDWITKARESNKKVKNDTKPFSHEQKGKDIDQNLLSDFSEYARFAFHTSREGTGFESYAKGFSKDETRYLLMIENVKSEFQVADETLSSLEVFEAVTIGPCYTRTTKEVNDTSSRNEPGLFGRRQQPQKVTVFDHNEVQVDEKTKEQLVEIVYRTTNASKEYFMDEYGRRGNLLIWRAQVPRSLGERIAQRAKEYPHIIRLLIVSSIRVDIQGQRDFGGKTIDFSNDTSSGRYPYYDNGIPPYFKPEWQNSRMYIELQDFNVPRDEDTRWKRLTTKETSEQALEKTITLSPDNI